mmetsp:Transcript_12341/g.27021  ORF Transcript_12341/g.27021 Transcript_12341/m.27021 type:complete len:311 (-) Transcript_12341:91-1023(-)
MGRTLGRISDIFWLEIHFALQRSFCLDVNSIMYNICCGFLIFRVVLIIRKFHSIIKLCLLYDSVQLAAGRRQTRFGPQRPYQLQRLMRADAGAIGPLVRPRKERPCLPSSQMFVQGWGPQHLSQPQRPPGIAEVLPVSGSFLGPRVGVRWRPPLRVGTVVVVLQTPFLPVLALAFLAFFEGAFARGQFGGFFFRRQVPHFGAESGRRASAAFDSFPGFDQDDEGWIVGEVVMSPAEFVLFEIGEVFREHAFHAFHAFQGGRRVHGWGQFFQTFFSRFAVVGAVFLGEDRLVLRSLFDCVDHRFVRSSVLC